MSVCKEEQRPSMHQPRKALHTLSKPQQLLWWQAGRMKSYLAYPVIIIVAKDISQADCRLSQLTSEVCLGAELEVGDAYIGCRLRGREEKARKEERKKQYLHDRPLRIPSQQKYNLSTTILSRTG
jgi:hypothetical protein